MWGKNDPFFIPPGARAYLNDLPDAKLVWLDAAHFVLDENAPRSQQKLKPHLVLRVLLLIIVFRIHRGVIRPDVEMVERSCLIENAEVKRCLLVALRKRSFQRHNFLRRRPIK